MGVAMDNHPLGWSPLFQPGAPDGTGRGHSWGKNRSGHHPLLLSFVNRIGKRAVLCKDSPDFWSTASLVPYLVEAAILWEEEITRILLTGQ